METSEAAQLLLEDLDPNQREAATHQRGALCVLAGAGTGKTRAITYRIAYGVKSGQVAPENVLALSFTQKAAGELRSRLESLGVRGVEARTFHSAALTQVRHFWPQVMGGEMPRVTPLKATLLTSAGTRLGITPSKEQIRDFASEIEWAKVSLVSPADYAHTARTQARAGVGGLYPERMADLMQTYEEAKLEAHCLDFEDILLVCAGMIDERQDVAHAIRNRYRYFVVDEYQDVSPLQNYLLLRWLGKRRNLAVVGDAAQTIYSFAGATSDFLTDFKLSYPEAKVVELNRDYRSTPQIVELANQVLSKARSAAGEPLGGTVRLVSQKAPGAKVNWFIAEDDETEAEEIAQRIVKLVKSGYSPGDIAVLFRTNSQVKQYAMALSREKIRYVFKRNVGAEAGAPGDEAASESAVTLMSLHSAKGLEWRAVFIAGASEGLLPVSLAQTAAQIEEERRLVYVGITRAQELLTISYAKARFAQTARKREACRFLAELWPRAGRVRRASTGSKHA